MPSHPIIVPEAGDVLHAGEYIVMTVEPGDWGSCAAWQTERGAVSLRPAIGIHPQCAEEPTHTPV